MRRRRRFHPCAFNRDESDRRDLAIFVIGVWTGSEPVGGGGETGSFSNLHDGEPSAPHTFVPFAEEDQRDDRPSQVNVSFAGLSHPWI